MPRHDLVVIGASAGGLEAVSTILERLPPSLPACVLVVMHTPSNGTGALPSILERISRLPVSLASQGDTLQRGRVYLARPDRHLIVEGDGLELVHGPRENGFRPAIDPLFRTAARALGPRVIGVVLSGALSDGTYGLSVIKHCGGVAIVQDPGEASMPSMPLNALKHVEVDHVLRAEEIASVIQRLTTAHRNGAGGQDMPVSREPEPQRPGEESHVGEMQERYGPPSALTCPDCGGALWEVQDGRVIRYQCHVGHQFAPDNLEARQSNSIEGALWSAVRVLEEHAELKMRMAHRAAGGGLDMVSESFEAGDRDAQEQAHRIRTVLFGLDHRGQSGEGRSRTRPREAAAARPRSAEKRRREAALAEKGVDGGVSR